MDGYLSQDPARIAENQRTRRKYMTRIDYMPGKEALAIIEAKRGEHRPNSASGTNSAVLDAIVEEWATLTGIKYRKVDSPMTSGREPELIDSNARAYDFGPTGNNGKQSGRVACGAKRHRDGQPCEAKPEPGKARCRFHGGKSTGPRTPEGRARSLANLRQAAGRSA